MSSVICSDSLYLAFDSDKQGHEQHHTPMSSCFKSYQKEKRTEL